MLVTASLMMSSLLTRLVRVDGEHGGEDFADLAFGGLMGSNQNQHQYRHKKTLSDMLNLSTRKIKLYLPTSYRKQYGKATAARHPVEEHLYVNL